MSFARAIYRITPVLLECTTPLRTLNFVSASYSVKMQHRRPVKVYKHDGETEFQDSDGGEKVKGKKTFAGNDEIKGVIELDKINVREYSREKHMLSTSDEDSLEDIESEEGSDENKELSGTKYSRLGDSDITFQRWITKTQSKRQRDKSNIFMLEGKRLIQEAITADILPACIFFTQKSLIEELTMPPGAIKLYKMPYNKMKKWSTLQTPPGIIAFCKIPKNIKQRNSDNLPLTLICDNVREPGNLGTILRTISGVGCSDILLTKGCTDVWDSKVLRGASGAHFHVPITSGLTWDDINEQVDKEAKIFIAHHERSQSHTMEEHTIATIPYFSIDYSCLSQIVVIVGGETEGISPEAVHFTRYRDGLKINIPLGNNMDSLNVGAAVSAILFEIKRQFIIRKSLNDNYVHNSNDVNVTVAQ